MSSVRVSRMSSAAMPLPARRWSSASAADGTTTPMSCALPARSAGTTASWRAMSARSSSVPMAVSVSALP